MNPDVGSMASTAASKDGLGPPIRIRVLHAAERVIMADDAAIYGGVHASKTV